MPKTERTTKKRGIRIKNRIILTAVFLVIELALIQLVVHEMQSALIWLYTLFELLSIITVIYLVNKRGNPSYKIAWIVFILLLPVFGLFIYLMWGGERMFPHLKRRMAKCESHYMHTLSPSEEAVEAISRCDSSVKRQAAFLSGESGYPAYVGTQSRFLAPGEVFFQEFLKELCQAKKYIFLEYFILAEGEMWDSILDILRQKARQGVEIKIIFDDFGSIRRQYRDFIARLAADGIEVSIFNPIKPSFNIFMNNRDHRKIAIIDGQVAFTGGINIGDEYINRLRRFGYWMDCGILIRGKAVDSFVAMFAVMWEYNTGNMISLSRHLLSQPVEGEGIYIPYSDGPMTHKSIAEGIYMQILNTAHRSVSIATPYLILDNNMVNVLTLASKSGVDVRILTPGVPDKKYVHPVTRFYYEELLEAGVKIYEYTPGFLHSKIFVSDDSVATVGSVNMDYRSFVFHFECGVWFHERETVLQVRDHFEDLLSQSRQITLAEWKKRSLATRFSQWFWHLFSPLM